MAEVDEALRQKLEGTQPPEDAFERLVRECAPKPPRLRIASSVTGAWMTPEQATDPAYWRRQFREPVRFSDALVTVLAPGRRAVIEVGPGGALSALVRQHPAAAGAIDERGAIVVKHPERVPKAQVDARGLDELRVPGIDADPALLDQLQDRAVGQDRGGGVRHGASLPASPVARRSCAICRQNLRVTRRPSGRSVIQRAGASAQ